MKGCSVMSIVEIIGGVVLLIASVLLIVLCLFQDQKADQNMASAITHNAYSFGSNRLAVRIPYTRYRKGVRKPLFAKIIRRYSIVFIRSTARESK